MREHEINESIVAILVGMISIFIIFFIVKALMSLNSDLVDEVRRGNKTLTCMLISGETEINPDKVTDYSDGVWYFVNGSAVNCTVH